MRIYFDTEFIEDGKTIDLLSIGLIREDGAELYLENNEADPSRASEWVRNNVIPSLGDGNARTTRADMAEEIRAFVGESPEFWAYFADYDWVVLCQLYGTMMDLPAGWPMYCRDLKQELDRGRMAIEQDDSRHNALSDAAWVRDACRAALGHQ